MTSPVKFFIPDSPQLARSLKGKLTEEHEKRLKQLVVASDWPDFTERRGYIRALELALRFCAEAEEDMRH